MAPSEPRSIGSRFLRAVGRGLTAMLFYPIFWARPQLGLAHKYFLEVFIMRRYSVNKHHSARKFRKHVGKAKVANFRGPMRGGIRF